MYFCTKVIFFVFHFISLVFPFYFLLSELGKLIVFSIYGIYNYQDCKQHVDVGINTLMSICDGLGPSTFLSKHGKGASYDGRHEWRNCFIPARIGISDFDVIIYKVLLPIL